MKAIRHSLLSLSFLLFTVMFCNGYSRASDPLFFRTTPELSPSFWDEQESAPSPTPTPEPPLPIPTPPITDDWYMSHLRDMAFWMDKYGDWASEDDLYDQLATRYIDPEKPMIALTFDDGPIADVTNGVLDVLEEYNVRATFFICGYRLKKEANAETLKRMLALGCEIGNHTYEHEKLTKVGPKTRTRTITKTNKLVMDKTGYTVTSLRPPGGQTSGAVRKSAKANGMSIILWSQSGNVHLTDPQKIADNVFKQEVNDRELRDGDIVLLHDTKMHMVEAVKIMVPRLLDAGYQLVTVQELLNLSECGYEPGIQYRRIDNYRD